MEVLSIIVCRGDEGAARSIMADRFHEEGGYTHVYVGTIELITSSLVKSVRDTEVRLLPDKILYSVFDSGRK